MRTKILAILLIISSLVYSQRLEYGFGLNLVKLEGTSIGVARYNNIDTLVLQDASSDLFCITIGAGINLPLYSIADEMNIGLQINANIGAVGAKTDNAPGGPGLNFYLPAYITYNYGAGTSSISNMPFGIGIGIGYQFSGYLLDVPQNFGEDNGAYSYAKPSLMIEVLDFWLFDNAIIRFETQLGGAHYIGKEYKNISYGYFFSQNTISVIIYINKDKKTIKLNY